MITTHRLVNYNPDKCLGHTSEPSPEAHWAEWQNGVVTSACELGGMSQQRILTHISASKGRALWDRPLLAGNLACSWLQTQYGLHHTILGALPFVSHCWTQEQFAQAFVV